MLADRHLAEEVTQDAFATLYVRMRSGLQPDDAGAWVRRVAIRRAIRESRRRRREQPSQQLLVGDDRLPDVDVYRALAQLPLMQRAAILLFYLDDQPVARIASTLGCSESTARVHLHRGRKRLAEMLGEVVEDADR